MDSVNLNGMVSWFVDIVAAIGDALRDGVELIPPKVLGFFIIISVFLLFLKKVLR